MTETGVQVTTPADRLIAAADLAGNYDPAFMPQDIAEALAEWLRCAARLMSAKTDGYQRWVDERRVWADAPLGHALNLADRMLDGKP